MAYWVLLLFPNIAVSTWIIVSAVISVLIFRDMKNRK